MIYRSTLWATKHSKSEKGVRYERSTALAANNWKLLTLLHSPLRANDGNGEGGGESGGSPFSHHFFHQRNAVCIDEVVIERSYAYPHYMAQFVFPWNSNVNKFVCVCKWQSGSMGWSCERTGVSIKVAFRSKNTNTRAWALCNINPDCSAILHWKRIANQVGGQVRFSVS